MAAHLVAIVLAAACPRTPHGASPAAYRFAMFILSVDGQRLLAKHGFATPALP